MIAAKLQATIIPVRIDGLDRILHQSWRMARPGPARVAFGEPLRLEGEDYQSLADRVEKAVRSL
jgi:1-acyl-sn-glycerol-3-phosphate acyltransferase